MRVLIDVSLMYHNDHQDRRRGEEYSATITKYEVQLNCPPTRRTKEKLSLPAVGLLGGDMYDLSSSILGMRFFKKVREKSHKHPQ